MPYTKREYFNLYTRQEKEISWKNRHEYLYSSIFLPILSYWRTLIIDEVAVMYLKHESSHEPLALSFFIYRTSAHSSLHKAE